MARDRTLLIGMALLAASCRSLFPAGSLDPFADRWFSEQLRAAGEVALRPTGRVDREVYRFSIIPSFAPTITVRITRAGSLYQLTATRLTGAGGYDPGKVGGRRAKSLSSTQALLLHQWITEMGFWSMPTAEPPVTEFHVDGTVWLLEAAEARRYHVVERSLPKETSPQAFKQLCLCLLEWSGAFDSPEPWFTVNYEDQGMAAQCNRKLF